MTQKNPVVYYIESFIEGSLGSFVVNFFLIPTLFILILFLPPISLGDWILSIGYEEIGINGGSMQDPSGLEVNFLPEGVKESFRAKLSVVPRSSFLEGTTSSLITAAESIPPNLIMKSPYYRIQLQWRNTAPDKVLLIVPLPREVDSINLLDLYAWNGNSWDWLPNEKIVTEGIIESQLDYLPESVVVMETHPINPSVSTDYVLDTPIPDNIRDTLVEINPRGLQLTDNGKIEGDLQELPPEIQNSTLRVIPTIRNWHDDGSIRSDLIDNLLIDATIRERHIRAIRDLVQRNAYQGIDLDYRGISPDLRQEFTTFVTELDEALPDNKLLSIRVDFPTQVSTEAWDSGAYDWQAIGRVADVIKVPTSPDPRAYTQGGQMETLLDWGVEQVNRYKIQLLLSTRSTEEVNGQIRNISYQQALGPIGSATVIGENDVVLPGQQLDFTLAGLQESTGIQFDQSSGAYWYAYLDDNDTERTVFLENAASIARKLQFVAQYNLRGVAIENLLDTNNDVQIWSVIRQFLNLVIPPVESQFSVVWRVQSQEGGVIAEEIVDLSNPSYKWTVPEEGTNYEVAAAIASSRDSAVAVPRGSVAVAIATATPTPTPTLLPTATPEPTATPRPTATPEPIEEAPAETEGETPASDSPPPVESAVGDLPFAYGIQADPRGNSAANIGLIKGMGFNWVKFQMAWKDVEPSPGNYGWGFWDEVIGQYSANGIQILLSIPKSPDWARPSR